jgi:hypothetical protein
MLNFKAEGSYIQDLTGDILLGNGGCNEKSFKVDSYNSRRHFALLL